MEKKNKLTKGQIFEIVWYSIQGVIALWGLVYIALGVIAHFLDSTSGLKKADANMVSTFGQGFMILGIIILAIATVLAVIVLLVFAKKADRDFEKKQRRNARLQARNIVETPVVDIVSETPDKAE